MARLTARLPERTFAITLVVRASFIWVVLRLVVGTATTIVPGPRTQSPWMLTIPAAIVLIGIVGALSLLDARRQNEDRFLANLGISEAVIVLLSMAPALVAELAIGVAGTR